ncbi:MAG TPA: SRPBCC domain-containing protein [Balneolaceae bacterium]
MVKTYNNISNKAVKKATGKNWEEWIALLDEEGAEKLSHKKIAAMLIEKGYIDKGDGWWAQAVTVGYEYAKNRRVKGQTADAGFQVGVQRTLSIDAATLWQFLTGPEGLAIWLGNGIDNLSFNKGEIYETSESTAGEIRSVYPNEKLRLTWQPADWDNETTLQLYLLAKGPKTALRFHQEKLLDSKQRQQMKEHWKNVLEQIKVSL